MDYHLLVCDDDRTQAKNIATLLKMSSIILEEQDIHPTIDLIATDAESVLDYLEFNSDLNNIIAFLDIQLDENSSSKGGLDLAQKIKTLNEKAQIIFITTHEELAFLTFQRRINPLDYPSGWSRGGWTSGRAPGTAPSPPFCSGHRTCP